MGYHKKKIIKGDIGEISKIREEFDELMDAHEQGNAVLELVELSDIIGAIGAYAKRYNVSLQDLVQMALLTKSAFDDGERK